MSTAGQAGAVDLALLGCGERDRAPRPLTGGAGAAGILAGLGAQRGLGRALPARAARACARWTTARPTAWRGARGDVAEHEHRVDPARGGLAGPRARARRTPLPPETDTSTSVLRRSRPTSCGRPVAAVCSSPGRACGRSGPARAARRCRRARRERARRARRGGRSRRCAASRGRAGSRSRSAGRGRRRACGRWRWRWTSDSPSALKDRATRAARASSPAEPGARSGKPCRARAASRGRRATRRRARGRTRRPRARVRIGAGRPSSEKATTKIAIRAGRNAVR